MVLSLQCVQSSQFDSHLLVNAQCSDLSVLCVCVFKNNCMMKIPLFYFSPPPLIKGLQASRGSLASGLKRAHHCFSPPLAMIRELTRFLFMLDLFVKRKKQDVYGLSFLGGWGLFSTDFIYDLFKNGSNRAKVFNSPWYIYIYIQTCIL